MILSIVIVTLCRHRRCCCIHHRHRRRLHGRQLIIIWQLFKPTSMFIGHFNSQNYGSSHCIAIIILNHQTSFECEHQYNQCAFKFINQTPTAACVMHACIQHQTRHDPSLSLSLIRRLVIEPNSPDNNSRSLRLRSVFRLLLQCNLVSCRQRLAEVI